MRDGVCDACHDGTRVLRWQSSARGGVVKHPHAPPWHVSKHDAAGASSRLLSRSEDPAVTATYRQRRLKPQSHQPPVPPSRTGFTRTPGPQFDDDRRERVESAVMKPHAGAMRAGADEEQVDPRRRHARRRITGTGQDRPRYNPVMSIVGKVDGDALSRHRLVLRHAMHLQCADLRVPSAGSNSSASSTLILPATSAPVTTVPSPSRRRAVDGQAPVRPSVAARSVRHQPSSSMPMPLWGEVNG